MPYLSAVWRRRGVGVQRVLWPAGLYMRLGATVLCACVHTCGLHSVLPSISLVLALGRGRRTA